jgi:hypothetical protein
MVFNREDLLEATAKILEENGIRYPYSADLRPVWEAANPTAPKSAQMTCCAVPPAAN